MKTLLVGDPHIKINNITESEKLIDFVAEIAKKQKVDQIVFLGDLFHTHAIKRLEVENFWQKSFDKLDTLNLEVIVLVGNHDIIGSKELGLSINSLNVFKNDRAKRIIVDTPMIHNNIAYVPYTHEAEDFIKKANDLYESGARLLIAHQTFQGAAYENNFYAPDGIDASKISFQNIIAGHIHKSQTIGKVWYPGTPKWDTTSDANEDKGIWVINHDDLGCVNETKFYSTSKVVTPIYKYVVNEGEAMPRLDENAKNHIELVGSSAWIKQISKKIKNKASIKAKTTDRKTVSSVESNIKLEDLIDNFQFAPQVTKKQVLDYIGEINGKQ